MLPLLSAFPCSCCPWLPRPSSLVPRTLGLVAVSYFFLALCLTSVLWCNVVADDSTLLDTVNGWFFGAGFLMVWATLFSAWPWRVIVGAHDERSRRRGGGEGRR